MTRKDADTRDAAEEWKRSAERKASLKAARATDEESAGPTRSTRIKDFAYKKTPQKLKNATDLQVRFRTGAIYVTLCIVCILVSDISTLVFLCATAGICAGEFYYMLRADAKLPNEMLGIIAAMLYPVSVYFLGVVGALACVIGWGSEAVILTWGMRDEAVDNEVALQIRETTSAVVYLFIVAPIAGVFGFTLHSLAHLSAGVVALAGLAGTASYLFYYKALSAIGASRGMALNISYSAWAIIFALVLQGTVPTAIQVACCVVILVGTVLAATSNWGDLLPRRAEKVSGQ